MMMPTVVVGPDGTTLAAGSGGSERIPAAMARVLTGMLDRRLPLAEVIDAPRLHWDGALLQVEPGLSEDVLDRLRAEHPVGEWTVRDLYFGGAHAVARRPDGTVEVAADPRRGGASLVVDL
jgi:gamma-glutamyltranspeptidase/glutathione hydrolase